jgi:hypothetical protein
VPARKPLISLTLAAVLAGCGSSGGTTTETGPTGPPSVAFAEPASGQGAQCVSTLGFADAEIPLLVSTEELVLRPPLACDNVAQCGHLELLVDGLFNNNSSVPTINLLLRKLGDPIHDGSIDAGTGEPDVLRVLVRAVDSDGVPFVDEEDIPIADEMDLITVEDCEQLSEP